MKSNESRRFKMFTQVREFGVTHKKIFIAGSLGEELLNRLNVAIEKLQSQTASQTSGGGTAREGTSTKALLRAALHDDLEAINRTARAMAIKTPGLENKFRMPRSNTDQALLATARAFVQDAEPLATEFIRRELPENFLEDLNGDIEEFEQAINHHFHGKEQRVTATSAIDEAIDEGMDAVRELDAIVRNKFRDNATMLAAWGSASHIERPTRAVKKLKPEEH